MVGISFECENCGEICEFKQAQWGCPACKKEFFKVARRELPLIQNPQENPYRDKKSLKDNTDGDQFTGLLGEGDISGSGLGQNSRADDTGHDEVGDQHGDENVGKNHNLPKDEDAFDPYATPSPDSGAYDTPNSNSLVDENSPLNPINKMYEPKHTGPFNMPHDSRVPSIYNAWKGRSVYERIRNKTKGR